MGSYSSHVYEGSHTVYKYSLHMGSYSSHVYEGSVTQLCPTLSNSVDWSPPGSSVHGIFQVRILE